MIRENLTDVERRIKEACLRCGREPSSVRLIAVSKTKPAEMIQEAIAAGILDFGENKPQELRDKYDILPKNLRWHMIGNLQRNKVKYVVGRAVMIHSLGSDELAESIEKEAEKKDLIMPVLAEVNMAGESSKSGLTPEETEAFLRRVSSMKHLKVKGLMTIAPMTEFPEENRVYFRELRNMFKPWHCFFYCTDKFIQINLKQICLLIQFQFIFNGRMELTERSNYGWSFS